MPGSVRPDMVQPHLLVHCTYITRYTVLPVWYDRLYIIDSRLRIPEPGAYWNSHVLSVASTVQVLSTGVCWYWSSMDYSTGVSVSVGKWYSIYSATVPVTLSAFSPGRDDNTVYCILYWSMAYR